MENIIEKIKTELKNILNFTIKLWFLFGFVFLWGSAIDTFKCNPSDIDLFTSWLIITFITLTIIYLPEMIKESLIKIRSLLID